MTTFTDLYRQHSHQVYRFALWMCGNEAEAEDITAETFTRALVKAYCKNDSELSTVLEAGEGDPFGENDMPLPVEEVEMRILRNTKKKLRTRSTVLGLAIFFSLAPFSFIFTESQGMRWIVLENPPWYPATLLVLALLTWTTYVVMRHRMRSTGL